MITWQSNFSSYWLYVAFIQHTFILAKWVPVVSLYTERENHLWSQILNSKFTSCFSNYCGNRGKASIYYLEINRMIYKNFLPKKPCLHQYLSQKKTRRIFFFFLRSITYLSSQLHDFFPDSTGPTIQNLTIYSAYIPISVFFLSLLCFFSFFFWIMINCKGLQQLPINKVHHFTENKNCLTKRIYTHSG